MGEISNSFTATDAEFAAFVQTTFDNDEFAISRTRAIFSGWDKTEYYDLLSIYLQSTQEIDETSSAKESKGDPFEEVARYFLEKGGLSRGIKSLKDSSVWELDGQGILNLENLREVWGKEDTMNAGNSMILECKNHSSSVSVDEFSKYRFRMSQFNCQLGVIASTCGFAINSGKGIAEEIFIDIRSNRYHLLLSVEDFCKAYFENIPPLHILTVSLNNAKFNKYKVDKELQKNLSSKHCSEIAKYYFDKLGDSSSP